MSFYIFYFAALIPIIIGGILFIKNKQIIWQEWAMGAGISVLTAIVFHLIAYLGQTSDVETWSGQLNKAIHYPEWRERYQQMHTRTVGSGKNKRTEIYWTTEYRWNREYYECYSDIGTSYVISSQKFNEMKSNFGESHIEKPGKSGFCGGDENIYVSLNKSGYNYPITTEKSWTNKVKACPSVFSFAKVPKDIQVFDYPKNNNPFISNRLLGVTNIDILEFDRMNARLGPTKNVNVIVVGFNNKDSSFGKWQEAKWVGGSKNDIVISYSLSGDQIDWVYCFGWTESKICLRNLESIVLENGIKTNVLPLIESEIKSNYRLKDWSKFDYLSIQPPFWSIVVFFIILIGSQSYLYYFFHTNNENKDNMTGFNRYGLKSGTIYGQRRF